MLIIGKLFLFTITTIESPASLPYTTFCNFIPEYINLYTEQFVLNITQKSLQTHESDTRAEGIEGMLSSILFKSSPLISSKFSLQGEILLSGGFVFFSC